MIPLSGLLMLFVKLVIGGLIFWVFWWAVDACKTPEPFNRVFKVIIVVCAVVFLVSILLALSGTALFR